MRKIFKYPLHGDILPKSTQIMLPDDHKILHLAGQDKTICIWAEVDPTRALKPIIFEIFATGETIEPENVLREYIGTAHLFYGAETYHVYRRVE